MDRHDLYELCVQSPDDLVPFLAAIHGRSPRHLGEDFAGTAALSLRWAQAGPDRHAIAVDHDAATLGRHPPHPRVQRVVRDVLSVADPSDVIFVGNFSIGYLHTRGELLGYLTAAAERLARAPNPPGVFVCDTYGGESAFLVGEVHRDHWIFDRPTLPDALRPLVGRRVRYTWEQRSADPTTGRVLNALHFRIVDADGQITHELADAFVYDWRLWSVPELRDAMLEAGFARTEVYARTADAVDESGEAHVIPIRDGGEELEESFIVCVAGRLMEP